MISHPGREAGTEGQQLTAGPLMMRPDQPDQEAVDEQTEKGIHETSEGIAEDAVRKLKGSHPTLFPASSRRHAGRSTEYGRSNGDRCFDLRLRDRKRRWEEEGRSTLKERGGVGPIDRARYNVEVDPSEATGD